MAKLQMRTAGREVRMAGTRSGGKKMCDKCNRVAKPLKWKLDLGLMVGK